MAIERSAAGATIRKGGIGGIFPRSGGVRHPPEADIESIRDLLRGYKSSGGILKELIQNAEDAAASRMDVRTTAA